MSRKAKPMPRINTRIRVDQQKYVKTRAKKEMLTEGEVFRDIIDNHMKLAGAYSQAWTEGQGNF